MHLKNRPLYAADIFCGGGGLTAGLKLAGFSVVTGVELDSYAVSTYKVNHPEVHVLKQDVVSIRGDDLIERSPSGKIDLLAGCPPCQGFTSLTAKYRREDERNRLIDEMARLAEEVKPKVLMIENVPGLLNKGRSLFDKFLLRINKAGYKYPTYDVLQVADYGVPQSRRRLVLLAGKGFKIEMPSATHSRTGSNGLPMWNSVECAIKGLPKPITLEEANARGGCIDANWHVVRTLSKKNQSRLKHAKPGAAWSSIPKRLRPKCHQHKDAGFSNVYGRMRWNDVSPTITAGCTTLSTGRFGHPSQLRTISVLEAALLQTFPREYIFDCEYMGHVCKIIGNALPCEFARLLSAHCRKVILQQSK